MDYIKPELLVVAVMLYVIGMMLKTASFVKDKFIPLILGGTGIFIALVWVIGTTELSSVQDWFTAFFTGAVQGVLCAGAAVYVNQLIKQARKDE